MDNPSQASLPFAKVDGEPLAQWPQDLFIPPEALEVILETFEGPLDLLLYLIRKQKLDILNLPIQRITEQYLDYIKLLQGIRVELAADYLVMAATLAEIKSRLLLPRPELEEDEHDPRLLLIKQLQAYEVVKQAAEDIEALPRLERDTFVAVADSQGSEALKPLAPQVEIADLVLAFSAIAKRAAQFEHHHISREKLSTREKMSQLLSHLDDGEFYRFGQLFDVKEGRAGVLVTFLALMELLKEALIELLQAKAFDNIYVRLAR
ncbi:segregation and condensation protein A [Paraferrimonas haliotis]|uniref:Segregation and condensation protein A n=1 Tax=Paraferrimonas haliotis TaxID=2013866 RepID=A0AA37TP31_9GAMM|nr:ScpA family protein [Paraferrimonas haliotis]GLS84148.1 segregation and condensation protein A [Paraferrimonas haliotis]